jgi:hypothetical protein
LQNGGKKKSKPNGIHKLAALDSTSIVEGHDQLSPDCKPATEGRLVIRLPLKFKTSPEDRASVADSLSSDSEDKPLSETLSMNRKAIKSGKKKKKKKNFGDLQGAAEADHVSDGDRISQDDKKMKVKKPKSEKQLKNGKKMKREVENANETVAVQSSVRFQCRLRGSVIVVNCMWGCSFWGGGITSHPSRQRLPLDKVFV